ncbi:putative glycosyltransferase EpsE [Geobacter sp. OR-1]|uniref:glycosyltransferase family 2 protein n=1 Tax=Geobacter sp. OR-1 TaxID=1266765 RepID=UPI00054421AB|nr:glycosyltransferase [Geobacter sp. OR-1]GAM08519.1 putative glycosyltransferase EpsE [Geobacter sp. OR-1]
MRLPAISILMPVRNEARYVRAALASLYAQTCGDWELVVVDDGSSDATPEILAEASHSDSRIRVLTNPGKGLVEALNLGLTNCRGKLVARMDGDDVSHPCRLDRQQRFLTENPDVGLVACSFRHFPRQHLKVGMLAYEEWQNRLLTHEQVMADLFVESPFVHPGVMARKSVLESAGGYRDPGWAEDYDLWLRLAADGCRFARLAEVLFFWRDRPERSTRTMAEYTAEAFRRCKAHHLKNGYLDGHKAVTLIGAGIEGRAWRKALAEQGIAVSRWVDLDPRKVGKVLHGAPVVAEHSVTPGSGPMLVTIGTRGARGEIRKWAAGRGLAEGVDFVCVT